MDEILTSPQSPEFAAKFERIFLMARLVRVLRFQTDQIVRQSLPGDLQHLVDRLASAERDGKWFGR